MCFARYYLREAMDAWHALCALIMRPWNGHHFNPQSGFSNGDEGSHWLAPGKMRSSATGGRRGAHTSRAPTPKARTEGPTGATIRSACGSAKTWHNFLYF